MFNIQLAVALCAVSITLSANSVSNNTLFFADYDNASYEAVYAAGNAVPTVHGHPLFKPGRYGSSVLLTKGNFLEYPAKNNIYADQGTLEFWYQAGVEGDNVRRHMITVYNSEKERFYIRQTASGQIGMFFVNNTGSSASMLYDGASGGWHHIAITWKQKGTFTELSGYADGRRCCSKNIPNFPDFSNGRIIVGNYAGFELPLNGLIDDLRISDDLRYTDGLYPEFFFAPDIIPLKKQFVTLRESTALVSDDTVRLKTESLCRNISGNFVGYNAVDIGKKPAQYQVIKGQLSKLEDSVLPFAWWRHRKLLPLAVIPHTCMKKINNRWKNMPISMERIALNSAGGEWQAFQIVLAPGLRDVNGITIKALPLQAEKNAIAVENVHVFRVGTLVPQQTDEAPAPVWADPLYPLTEPLAIPLNRIQSLWVSIKVPKETPEGLYKGKIVIEMDGVKTVIPYQINVYGFTLQSTPRLKTAFGFAGTWMAGYYKLTSDTDIRQMMDKYLNNMLAHKVSPKALWRRGKKWNHEDRYFLTPRIIRDRDGKWRMEFADYDQQLDKLMPLGLNSIMVGLRSWSGNARGCDDPFQGLRKIPFFDENTGKEIMLTVGVLSSEHETLSKWIVQEWYAHLKERGLADMAYTYVVDEPSPQLRPLINIFCGWIHDVAPGLPNMITAVSSENCPNVDIWCPLTRELPGKKLRAYISDNNKTLWTYVCCGPLNPHANFFTHQSALQNRLPLWIGYKYGATGFLYYETGRSMYHDIKKFPGWPGSAGSEGDGFLVYPGPDGPINTIRFEYVRMGIQDVEYFLMLKDFIKDLPEKDKLRVQAEQLLTIGDDLIRTPASYSKQWHDFQMKKHSVAKIITKIVTTK